MVDCLNRIYLLEPDVVFYAEAPEPTLECLESGFKVLWDLTAKLDKWYLVVDVCPCKPPNGELRKKLRELYGKTKGIQHIAVITGLNPILSAAIGFIAARSFNIPFSIVNNHDAAVAKIKAIKEQSNS